MLPKHTPTFLGSWSDLEEHYNQAKNKSLLDLFNEEKDRSYLRHSWNDFFIDFSKNHIDQKSLALLKKLTEEAGLEQAKEAMYTGKRINETEDRSVLHVALRALSKERILSDGENVLPAVKKELKKIRSFTKNLHEGQITGYTGKKIQSIVNIGIGGSDLGPLMVTTALKPFWKKDIRPHFVSNIDASDISGVLEQVDPETTLFIIASKTFTTQETMTNANTAREWFLSHSKDRSTIQDHFVAVSTNREKVVEFGINEDNMFVFWDWVGGRYSLWSSIGLSIACAVGYEHFEDLLKGAEAMDDHFHSSPFEENLPTLAAMIGIWYNNFFKTETQAILPYDHLLKYFSKYLQQGDMESNGKSTSRDGKKVDWQTGQIIWGEPGTNGQHAFYQLIHQGTKIIPCDFIGFAQPVHKFEDHHQKLLANFIAQTEALMKGKKENVVREELKAAGKTEEEIKKILPFKVFSGNKPTTSILIKKLTPNNLGSLIALYEHKIFVQGVIWNIFSFDQWGVELGKQLAGNVLKEIKSGELSGTHDESTREIIKQLLTFSKT